MVDETSARDDTTAGVLVTVSEPGADAERLDELTRMLRDELSELADGISPVSGGEAPEGTRAIDIATVGALMVAVKGSVEAVTAIVTAVRGWLHRGSTTASAASSHRVVELTIGENTLHLDSATPEEQERLVREFVQAIHAH